MAAATHSVIVAPALFGKRYEVTLDPPLAFFPLRSFVDYPEAVAFAHELERLNGWPILDRANVAAGERQ